MVHHVTVPQGPAPPTWLAFDAWVTMDTLVCPDGQVVSLFVPTHPLIRTHDVPLDEPSSFGTHIHPSQPDGTEW